MADSPQPPARVVDALRASHLKETLHAYSDALRARRKGIDSLNVYPVPDGDTGTNMALTVQSVVAELRDAAGDDMHAISAAISKGAIMGARGNSGAILAQALRGLAESVKEKVTVEPADVADALEHARAAAYESVLKPVEGTILTVLTAAATEARVCADAGNKLKDQLDHVRQASADALARTPELLPILKQAGVVDAGGSGFLLFVDALRYVATGEPIPGQTDEEIGLDSRAESGKASGPDLSEAHSDLSDLRFEVMFLLDSDDSQIPNFREAWSHLGDSIVVVGGDGLWNCHIHTDDLGPVIETGIAFGKPHQIRITDLQEQAGQEHGEAWTVADGHTRAPVATAVVAVVNGNGLARIYRSFGVHEIVTGGQSMNPSVAELLHVVEAAPSDEVIVLPNNKNILAAARQLDALTDKKVYVLPTTNVVQGMSALVGYDSDKTAAENIQEMQACSVSVVVGEVTQAVRDSDGPGGTIVQDDWLGIGPGGIIVVTKDLAGAICELAGKLVEDTHEVVTLVEGEGSSKEVTANLRDWLTVNRPNAVLEVHEGGQPLYPYFLGME